MKNVLNIAWYKTVQAKLILFTMLASTLLLGGFAFYNISTTEARLNAELNRLAEVTSQRLSRHLVTPMWDLDVDQVAESITAEMLEYRVYAIIVKDSDGQKTFNAKQRDEGWNVVDSTGSISGDYRAATAEISNGSERIGVVDVYVTPSFMQQELNEVLLNVVVVVLVLDLIIFLTLWAVARKVLVRPILELANSAERISKGQLNVTFDIHSDDEIGHLADAFRRLQMSLRLAIRRLKEAGSKAAA